MHRPLLLCIAFLLAGPLAWACQPTEPLRYSLQLIPSEVGGADTVRRIALGSNDCLQVHYPRFDVRAGDWSMNLPGNERAALDGMIAELKPMPFDPTALAARKAAVELQLRQLTEGAVSRPQISYVAGASRHVLEIAPGTPQARKLAWTALAHDAQRYVELPELATLWRAVEALMALSEDPRLQRLSEPSR
jgi:hypothetical protein